MDNLPKLPSLDPAKKVYSLFDEFKAFAFKGNVIDLAVGVIIGTAFGKIVSSLVKDIIMPMVGVLLPGDRGYEKWTWTLRGQTVPYGLFVAEVVNFLIVAAALFLFVAKFLGWLMHAKKTQEQAPIPPTKEEALLTEIRDLLRDGGARNAP